MAQEWQAAMDALAERVRHLETLESITSVGEGPGIDVVANSQVGLGGDTILLYDSGGAPVAEYAPTEAGLTAAVAAATAGDTIVIPSMTITLTGTLIIATANIAIVGMGRDKSVITSAAAADTLVVRNIVTFASLGISNTNAGNFAAMTVDNNSAYVVLLLCHLTGNGGNGLNQSHGQVFGIELLADSISRNAVVVWGTSAASCMIREGVLDAASNANLSCARATGDGELYLRRVTCRKTGGGTGWHLRRDDTAVLAISCCCYDRTLVSGVITYDDGLTGTLTLDDGANWRITLTFTGGFLTGQTTGASVAATATWV
jgi:hypothetical protein